MGDETITLTFAGEPEKQPIMSARDAMLQAIERAQMGEFGGARTWVAIAAELRAGEIASASIKGILANCAGEQANVRFTRPPPFAEESADETVILNTPEVCAQSGCGLAIGLAVPNAGGASFWAHLTTGQRVCPGTPKAGGHTYAIPKVDSRG